MMRKAVMVALALLVLAVLVPFAALLWLDGERLESLAASYFERVGGVQVEMDNVNRTFSLSPRITVEGLSMRKEQYEEPLFHVERGGVSISLPSLLFGPVQLQDIVVDSAEIEVPVDDGGVLYWGRAVGDLLRRLKGAGVSISGFHAADLKIDARHTGGRGESTMTVASVEGTMPEPADLAFTVRELRTEVEIASPLAMAGELVLDELTLEHVDSAAQPVRLNGRGRVAGQGLRIHMSAGNPLRGAPQDRQPFAAELEIEDSIAKFAGWISRGSDRHLYTEVALDINGLGDVSSGSADFKLYDAGAAWVLEGLSANWGETTVSGGVTVERREPRPYLSGQLALTGLGLGGKGSAADAAPESSKSATRAVDAQALGERLAHWTERLDLLDAELDIDFHDLRLYVLNVPEVQATLRLSDSQFTLPINGRLLAGSISAMLEVAAGAEPPAATFSLDMQHLETTELLAVFDIDRQVQGSFNVHADLQAQALSTLFDTVAGSAWLTMSGGRLGETLAQVADQDFAAAILGGFGGDDTTPIRCAVADFDGRDGVFEAQTLIVDTGEVKLVGDGRIDVADWQLDMSIRPHAKDFSLLSASAPVRIDGSLSDPGFSTDIGEAVGSVLTPIELGQAEDAACRQLIEEANASL